MRHVELEKWQTFRLMLEKEQKYVETLNQELQISSEMSNSDRNSKLKKELIGAERRVQILQDQLSTFNEIPVTYLYIIFYTRIGQTVNLLLKLIFIHLVNCQ